MKLASRRASILVLAALSCIGGAAASACGGGTTTPGQLVLVVSSDMSAPKDVDTVGVEVVALGAVRYSSTFPVSEQGVLLPATLTLVAGKDPSTPVTVRVMAGHAGAPARVLREVITTVPPDRIGMLRVPISWLSDGSAKVDPTPNDPLNKLGFISTCPAGQTDLLGTCVDQNVDVRSLVDYAPEEVWGAATANDAAAFDVVSCFGGAAVATVDTSDCSIPGPSSAHDHWNVGLRLPDGKDGFCGGGACYVPLDNIPTDRALFSGWKDAGSKIQLPPGVCTKLAKGGFDVVTSTACVTKHENTAVCGSGSAVKSCTIKSTTPLTDGGGAHGPVTTVSLGAAFSCALRDKKVICWGSNDQGELGRNTNGAPKGPDYVPLPGDADDIAAGSQHACAAVGGTVYCWGNLQNLLAGGGANTTTPVARDPALATTRPPVIYAARGGNHDCFVTRTNTNAVCFGSNDIGQLGVHDDGGIHTEAVPAPTPPQFNQILGLGGSFTCAEPFGGQISCWGDSTNGQLGAGETGPDASRADPREILDGGQGVPLPVIAAGGGFACTIGQRGQAYCWGDDILGELGRGLVGGPPSAMPAPVSNLSNVVDICAGSGFACAISQSNVSCWGEDTHGQIGDGKEGGQSAGSPQMVKMPTGFIPAHLACGMNHACAWDTADRVVCWGDNAQLQIQIGQAPTALPVDIPMPN